MIRSFKHKGLSSLFRNGTSAKINRELHARILRRLDALNMADELDDLKVPGFDLHVLRGYKPKRYTMHVNGPWCITFAWSGGHAEQLDLEQYH